MRWRFSRIACASACLNTGSVTINAELIFLTRLVECMISKEGQTLIADGKGVISLNVDVPNMMEDVPGLEDEINNNAVYIRYSAQK